MPISLKAASGGGGLPRLAPDLDFPSQINSLGTKTVVITNAATGLRTLLSLSGKFSIKQLSISGLTANENITIRCVVDSEEIWNSTFLSGGINPLYLMSPATITSGQGFAVSEEIMCNSSFSLQIQTTTVNTVTLQYHVRPIK
jgi:hypothetical protein